MSPLPTGYSQSKLLSIYHVTPRRRKIKGNISFLSHSAVRERRLRGIDQISSGQSKHYNLHFVHSTVRLTVCTVLSADRAPVTPWLLLSPSFFAHDEPFGIHHENPHSGQPRSLCGYLQMSDAEAHHGQAETCQAEQLLEDFTSWSSGSHRYSQGLGKNNLIYLTWYVFLSV